MAELKDRSTEIVLDRSWFTEAERTIVRVGGLSASLFRYPTGVEAIRLSNPRGHVIVLPFLGQMVWRAMFEGVELAMRSLFDMPRPATGIIETYGALMYHAGLLRAGVPGPEDTHALHGEMPCLPMDRAGLLCGINEGGAFIAVTGERDYAMGFGAHYLATPRVTLGERATAVSITMAVENLGATPMDLMYLCHVNFAFAEGARIVQPVPFDSAHVAVRTVIPSFVAATPDYKERIAAFAADPSRMERLDDPGRFDPEQVCYIRGLKPGPDGRVTFMLARREGDGFTIAYDPVAMPHTIRWLLANGDQQVAAFAMPATCEPEGYTAEKRKGHIRSLASGARATFTTEIGYASATETAGLAKRIMPQAG